MNLRTCLFASLALLVAGCNPDAVVDFPSLDTGPAGRDAAMPPDAEEAGEDASSLPRDARAAWDVGTAGLDAATAGLDAGTAGLDATVQEVIKVTCTGPANAIPVNTRVDITCVVDNSGRATATPILRADPAPGAVFTRGSTDTQLNFALSTSAPGYMHPLDFADSEVKLSYEVHDAANGALFGRATVTVSVLGNYWVGDSNSSGMDPNGVLVYTSNGAPLGQAVSGTQIKGVYDIRNLPDGTLAVSSLGTKSIRVFDRKGNPKATTFPDTDPFNGAKIWESTSGFEAAGPRQMAVAGDQLWVAGAKETDWGLAVFNWKTGAFLRFVATPVATNAFPFTSLIRRNDGVLLAGSMERKPICAFDEKTYAPLGSTPCVTLGDTFCDGWSSFALLSTGEVAAVEKGYQSNKGCPIIVLGPTMNLLRSKALPEGAEVYGMVESGAELVGLTWSQYTTGQNWFLRANPLTLDSTFADWWTVKAPAGLMLLAPRGLARLTKL